MSFRTKIGLIFIIATATGAAAQTGTSLNASPNALFFRNPTGGALTQAITVTPASAVSATVAYTLPAPSPTSWLKVTTSGSTVTVTAQPNGIASGVYSATVTVSAAGFNSLDIPVVLSAIPITGGTTPVPASVLVVSPSTISFQAVQSGPGNIPPPVMLFNPGGDNYDWTSKSSQPWLTVTPSSGHGDSPLRVAANASGYAPGTYTGQISVTGGVLPATTTAIIQATMTVTKSQSATLGLQPQIITLLSDGTAPVSQELQVFNTGNTPLSWTAQTNISSGNGGTGSGSWLAISPTSGTSTTGTQNAGIIGVSGNPAGLGVGLYSGSVVVNGGNGVRQTIPVYMRVGRQRVAISQHELLFNYGAGGGSNNPIIFTIAGGPPNTAFSITPSTTNNQAWFTVTPVQGNIAASTAPTPTQITVTPLTSAISKFTPGVYYGQIQIKTIGAAQEVTTVRVVLKVFGPTELPRQRLEPGGLIFTAVQGQAVVPSATVTLSALNATAGGYQVNANVSTVNGGNWLSVNPNLALVTPSTPLQLSVMVQASGLLPNSYYGTIAFTPVTGTAPPIFLNVAMVVTQKTPAGGPVTGPLIGWFTNPSQEFISQPELPNTVTIAVLDAGGNAVPGATVLLRSTDGNPDLLMTDLGSGFYTTQYRAFRPGRLTLTATATYYSPASGLVTSNDFTVTGSMEASQSAYIAPFPLGGVSAASYTPGPTPVAAGSLAALFGQGIAGTGGHAAPPFPLPSTLGNMSFAVAGIPGSLISATPQPTGDQINFQIPFELDLQSTAELIATVGNVVAPAETVVLGSVPAIFTAGENGVGMGIALHGDYTLVTAASPAAAGEVIMIYTTGLGALNEQVSTGQAAPPQTSTKNMVLVQIGGQNAPVSYSGLAPGFAGLYQVNAQVPGGLPSGDNTLVIFAGGNASAGAVTIPVK